MTTSNCTRDQITSQSQLPTHSYHPPQRTLMGPGPSDINPRVLAALARPIIGHMDPKFIEMMDQIKALLQYAFQTNNPLTLPISAPGSAGMEACFVNLLEPGDTAIVCQNGVFGGRMKENVERCGARCVLVTDPWGRAVNPEGVERAIGQNPQAKVLAFVHAETSTGAVSDAQTLCSLAQRAGMLSIVDTVTSLGGIEVAVDRWGADAVYSGTQKCLSCVPGLSPVTFSPRAIEAIKQRKTKVQSWFLDMNLIMGYWGSGEVGTGARRSYHHTAPINTLYALHEALLILAQEGLAQAYARHRLHHRALRAGLEALGMSFVVPEGERLPQLNAVTIPAGLSDVVVRNYLLQEFGLEIGGGLGDLAGKIWRIGLMGEGANRSNVTRCIAGLESALLRFGVRVDCGAGLGAAEGVYQAIE